MLGRMRTVCLGTDLGIKPPLEERLGDLVLKFTGMNTQSVW